MEDVDTSSQSAMSEISWSTLFAEEVFSHGWFIGLRKARQLMERLGLKKGTESAVPCNVDNAWLATAGGAIDTH